MLLRNTVSGQSNMAAAKPEVLNLLADQLEIRF